MARLAPAARGAGIAAVFSLLAACGPGGGVPGKRANLLLITLDTTRPDHLGAYGYCRPTSPRLDRFAAHALVFRRAYSTSSWTLPAHASLFTGRFPASHGAHYDPKGPLVLADALTDEPGSAYYRAAGLAPGVPTLASLLAQASYETGAIVAGPWLRSIFGLNRGFASYDDQEISSVNGRPAASVSEAAIRWLQAHGTKRFFLFLNYFDPHFPYQPHPAFLRRLLAARCRPAKGTSLRRRKTTLLYDGEIAAMDEQLGRVLDELRRLQLWERTWVVLTADHGELLGEFGLWGHGHALTEAEIRIPLLVKPPAGVDLEVDPGRPVQILDLLPTLLAGLGVPLPKGVQGERLARARHPILAELYPLPAAGRERGFVALVDGRWKLWKDSTGKLALYDIERDPGETRDLASRERDRTMRLGAELEAFLTQLPRPQERGPVRRIDRATREALESLGYLEREPARPGPKPKAKGTPKAEAKPKPR